MMIHELSISVGNGQDQGTRRKQEDYFATTGLKSFETHSGFLAIVADGMGGHADGGNASTVAIDEFITEYKKKVPAESIPEALHRALLRANEAVANLNREDKSNRGTTLVACVVHNKRFYWVSVGDSYLFQYRSGELILINKLHALDVVSDSDENSVEQTTQMGVKKRSVLTSYLGLEDIPEIDPSKKYLDWKPLELKLGDKLLLCSDGLVNTLELTEIARYLQTPQEPQQTCDQLLKKAKDKHQREQDNITIVLLELKPSVEDTGQVYVKHSRRKTIKQYWPLAALISFIMIMLIVAIFAIKSGFFTQLLDKFQWRKEFHQPSDPIPTRTDLKNAGNNAICPALANQIEQKTNEQKGKSCIAECVNNLNRVQVQKILKYKGFHNGIIDGEWGPNTEESVKKFQKQEQVEESGKLDKATCEKLANIYSSNTSEIDKIPSKAKDIQW